MQLPVCIWNMSNRFYIFFLPIYRARVHSRRRDISGEERERKRRISFWNRLQIYRIYNNSNITKSTAHATWLSQLRIYIHFENIHIIVRFMYIYILVVVSINVQSTKHDITVGGRENKYISIRSNCNTAINESWY